MRQLAELLSLETPEGGPSSGGLFRKESEADHDDEHRCVRHSTRRRESSTTNLAGTLICAFRHILVKKRIAFAVRTIHLSEHVASFRI